MTFDVHQAIFDEDGECDDEAFAAYVSGLLDAFEASPEGAKLGGAAWMDIVLNFGRSFFGATVANLQPGDFGEIVWDIIPRKVSCESAQGPGIVRELRAFWTFAGREFGLPQAAACLAVIGEGAEERLEAYLGDRRRFGMAKSMFMTGAEAGFDVHTPEGMAAWQVAYNAAIARSGAAVVRANAAVVADPRCDAERKAKRKREKAARKKSRR